MSSAYGGGPNHIKAMLPLGLVLRKHVMHTSDRHLPKGGLWRMRTYSFHNYGFLVEKAPFKLFMLNVHMIRFMLGFSHQSHLLCSSSSFLNSKMCLQHSAMEKRENFWPLRIFSGHGGWGPDQRWSVWCLTVVAKGRGHEQRVPRLHLVPNTSINMWALSWNLPSVWKSPLACIVHNWQLHHSGGGLLMLRIHASLFLFLFLYHDSIITKSFPAS